MHKNALFLAYWKK